MNQAGLNGSIQIHANCPELAEGAAGEEGKLNFAFDIPRSFDAEVLNSGAVVEVPAGETLEFSIAQGPNFDRRFGISCQAPLQLVPVNACDSGFDPTAEMQGKQKLVSSSSTTIVNSGRVDLLKVGNNLDSGDYYVAKTHGEGIKLHGSSGSDSNAAVPFG